MNKHKTYHSSKRHYQTLYVLSGVCGVLLLAVLIFVFWQNKNLVAPTTEQADTEASVLRAGTGDVAYVPSSTFIQASIMVYRYNTQDLLFSSDVGQGKIAFKAGVLPERIDQALVGVTKSARVSFDIEGDELAAFQQLLKSNLDGKNKVTLNLTIEELIYASR